MDANARRTGLVHSSTRILMDILLAIKSLVTVISCASFLFQEREATAYVNR